MIYMMTKKQEKQQNKMIRASDTRYLGKRSLKVARIVFISLIFQLFLLAVLEIISYHADKKIGYRQWVQMVIKSAKKEIYPDEIEKDTDPDNSGLSIRVHNGFSMAQSYSIGGQPIPSASTELSSKIYSNQISPSTPLIAIIGASSAYGFPYKYEDTFGFMLEEKLKDKRYRIINASIVGSRTWVLFPTLDKLLKHYKPQTIIIYPGYNDLTGWSYPDMSLGNLKYLSMAKILSKSNFFCFIQFMLMKSRALNQDHSRNSSSAFNIHKELEGYDYAYHNPLHHYSNYDPREWEGRKKIFLDNYEKNLHLMAKKCKKNGIQTIFLNSPIKYKLSPAWKHPQPVSLNPKNIKRMSKFIDKAVRLTKKDANSEAIDIIKQAIEIDSYPPILNYLMGVNYEALGEFEKAESYYFQCQENMIGNLGGVDSFNKRLYQAAKKADALHLDLRKIFDDHSHGTGVWFNEELIHDDCHPSIKGHQIIAESLLQYF